MRLLTIILLFFLTNSLNAQDTVVDLLEEIEKGSVQIDSISGNGNSSGTALEGYLVNQTDSELRINVIMNESIYFENSSGNQNMIATQIYGREGGYYSDGSDNYFIVLEPRERLPISLYSYCADFEKDNPSNGDSFKISSLPNQLSGIVDRIKSLEISSFHDDVLSAAQVALWLAQDVDLSDIRDRFEFSEGDLTIARRLLNN